jgi:hypothetical protein
MKKLLGILVFSLLLGGNALSQISKLENCYSAKSYYLVDPKKQYWTEDNYLANNIWIWDNEKKKKFAYVHTDIKPDKRFEVFSKFEESSFTIKLDNGIITENKIYSDFFYKIDKIQYEQKYNKPYGDKKYNLTDYIISNYTEDRIFADKINHLDGNNTKLKISEYNLVVDLLTNKVEIFVTSYDQNQNVKSKTDIIIYCKPPKLMESNDQPSNSFFKNILGDLLNK